MLHHADLGEGLSKDSCVFWGFSCKQMGLGTSGVDTGRWREFYRLTCYPSAKKDIKKVLCCVFMLLKSWFLVQLEDL